MKTKKVLLTFNGDRDPDYIDSKTEEKTDGPILTLLTHYQFDVIELFFTPDKDENVTNTISTIKTKYPSITVNRQPTQILDPTDYREIMSKLRGSTAAIRRQYDSADYFIFLSPGTPQMHSSWLLLAASGEVPAKLFQMRDPRQQKEGQLPVSEIDPQASWFPHVAVVKHDLKSQPPLNDKDIQSAIQSAKIRGSQETIDDIVDSIAPAALKNSSIMILGESGTGKELLANFIHHLSNRRAKPIVALNVTAVPDTLIESELFGYEKGSHAGADKRKIGRFEQAHEGTLFLDEVGDMGLSMQVKILRALQENRIFRLGGVQEIAVDVRIIAATNKNLPELIKKGLFREDLYFRLNVIPITLKPLRERRQDIGILAKHFVDEENKKNHTTIRLTDAALAMLGNYSWPGNIRELKNVIERAHTFATEERIEVHNIKLGVSVEDSFSLPEFTDGFCLPDYIEKHRLALIDKALSQTKTQEEAACLLGVTSSNINQRLKRSRK